MADPYVAPESRPEPTQSYGEPYGAPGPAGAQGPLPHQPHQPYQPYPDGGRAQSEYGQQPYPGPGRPADASSTRTLWILAYVFAGVALLIPLFGFAGIACGAVAWKRGSRRGRTATIVAIVVTVIAWVLGILYYTSS